MVSERDRDLEARDRAVKESRRVVVENAEYVNNVSDNNVLDGKCAVTITIVSDLRGRIADSCTAADGSNDILEDVHNRGNDMADSKTEEYRAGVSFGMYQTAW